jgi:hypothetical protein
MDLLQICPDFIPQECREDIAWIHHMLTRYPKEAHDASDLRATYRRTRNITACKIASRIWRAYQTYDSVMQSHAYVNRSEQVGILIAPPMPAEA